MTKTKIIYEDGCEAEFSNLIEIDLDDTMGQHIYAITIEVDGIIVFSVFHSSKFESFIRSKFKSWQ